MCFLDNDFGSKIEIKISFELTDFVQNASTLENSMIIEKIIEKIIARLQKKKCIF